MESLNVTSTNRSSSIAGAKPPAVVHCETNYDAIKVGASDKSRPKLYLADGVD